MRFFRNWVQHHKIRRKTEYEVKLEKLKDEIAAPFNSALTMKDLEITSLKESHKKSVNESSQKLHAAQAKNAELEQKIAELRAAEKKLAETQKAAADNILEKEDALRKRKEEITELNQKLAKTKEEAKENAKKTGETELEWRGRVDSIQKKMWAAVAVAVLCIAAAIFMIIGKTKR